VLITKCDETKQLTNNILPKGEGKMKTLLRFLAFPCAAVICITMVDAIALGQTTVGPNYPSTGANVTGVGTIAWSSPGNALTDNGSYATIGLTNVNETSNYLQTTNYGFAIPSGAQINGIEVIINRFQNSTTGTSISDNVVQLIKGGSVVGTNNASSTEWPTSSSSTATYGGTSELWGTTWTAAEINASNFGVALSAISGTTSDRTGSVDYISVRVTYTAGIIITGTPLSNFGAQPGTPSAEQSYTVSGAGLTNNIQITAPTDFQISTTSGSGFGSSLTLTQTGGSVLATPIYVRFNRASAGTSSGNITHTSTGATEQDVAVSGTAATVFVDGAFSSNTALPNSSSINITHTTGTATDRLMLVGVSWNCGSTDRTISSATFTPSGGSATSLANVTTVQYLWTGSPSGGNNYRYSAIYSLTNPNLGVSGTINITFSGSVTNGIIAGAVNFAGVDQTTPLGAPAGAVGSGNNTSGTPNPSVDLTALSGDELVFDNVYIGVSSTSHALSADAGQSELWNVSGYSLSSSFNTLGSSSTKQAAGSSVTMSWTTQNFGSTTTRWAIAAVPIKPVVPLPIQMASFAANVVRNNQVEVGWRTVSETNNYGFEIYRKRGDAGDWAKIGFVQGHGTTLAPQSYSYLDEGLSFGKYVYRIKQVDLDGTSETFPEMAVTVGAGKFVLAQNYPNPFNPSTVIEFVVPMSGHATMKVYNVLGQEVATLFNGNAEVGKINIARFDASNLPSGLYFYTLKSAGTSETKRMLLMK
jgi:hypothetical protein